MFERYTEKARRVIFFGRYEASQFGSPTIETEHLLLGLLREDKALTNRFLRSPHTSIGSIRKQIEARTTAREKVSTSVDLPLSQECKRVLAYAAEEAERLSHQHIGTEHLLLGLLREQKSFAAEILQERGLRISEVREELSKIPTEKTSPAAAPKEGSLLAEFSRDLTQAALERQLDPLIGREKELERMVQVLGRRGRSNPVLIGEPGVGKRTLVNGLAQRIAEGRVPSFLADKRVLILHLSAFLAGNRQSAQFKELIEKISTQQIATEAIYARLQNLLKQLAGVQNLILVVEELFHPGSPESSLDTANILKPVLWDGEIQCIAAATPADYRRCIEKEPWLERCFHVVNVPPPSQADTIKILAGIKDRYEKFHNVTYTDDVLKCAVELSERYLTSRYLPDKAIDLIDGAGARAKLRQKALPEEIVEVQKRIGFVVHRMENAIANHEFEKARFYDDEERKEREKLRVLREKYQIDETAEGTVTREDMEEVVASWTGVPAATLRQDSAPAGQDEAGPP